MFHLKTAGERFFFAFTQQTFFSPEKQTGIEKYKLLIFIFAPCFSTKKRE